MTPCKFPQGIMIDSEGYVYEQDGKGNPAGFTDALSAEYIDKGSADLEQDLDIDQREIEICIIIK